MHPMRVSSPHIKFREARERAGLSINDLAQLSGFASASIWDLEQFEGDLTSCYSPAELKQLCGILSINSADLFGESVCEPFISADELARRIEEECRVRNVSCRSLEILWVGI